MVQRGTLGQKLQLTFYLVSLLSLTFTEMPFDRKQADGFQTNLVQLVR